MASLNSFDFTGRLGKDPELRSLDGGKEVCNFSVAIDRYGDKPTLWVDVAVWGAGAAPCAKHLSKGSEVAVHGQIEEVRAYQTKAGEPGATLKVSTRDVTFIGGRQDSTPPSDVPADFQPVSTGAPADDDIPF